MFSIISATRCAGGGGWGVKRNHPTFQNHPINPPGDVRSRWWMVPSTGLSCDINIKVTPAVLVVLCRLCCSSPQGRTGTSLSDFVTLPCQPPFFYGSSRMLDRIPLWNFISAFYAGQRVRFCRILCADRQNQQHPLKCPVIPF